MNFCKHCFSNVFKSRGVKSGEGGAHGIISLLPTHLLGKRLSRESIVHRSREVPRSTILLKWNISKFVPFPNLWNTKLLKH